MQRWLIIAIETLGATLLLFLVQLGVEQIRPNRERDYAHVFVYERDASQWFLYSLKGSGIITGTYVHSANVLQIERNGAHCFQVDALPEDERVPPTLSWSDIGGQLQTVSKPGGLTALVCDAPLWGSN